MRAKNAQQSTTVAFRAVRLLFSAHVFFHRHCHSSTIPFAAVGGHEKNHPHLSPLLANWRIQNGIDAVPGVSEHSALLGNAASVDECKDMCSRRDGCNIFTWNHHVPPHHCFGGIDATARWMPNPNQHCTSGCRGAACDTAPPTAPPVVPSRYFPRWVGIRPRVGINASAGLPTLTRGVVHACVYNATVDGQRNPFGVYNHGPIMTKFNGVFYMSWYNAPTNETTDKRSVFATSMDGIAWNQPKVLFPPFVEQPRQRAGEENGPWTVLGVTQQSPGRLYTQSGTQDAGEHAEGIVLVMRRVASKDNATDLGPPFWLNRTVPSYCRNRNLTECRYPTYLQMDDTTRKDAEQYLASLVRTTVAYPDDVGAGAGASADVLLRDKKRSSTIPRFGLQSANLIGSTTTARVHAKNSTDGFC